MRLRRSMVPLIFGLKLKRQMFSKLSKAPQQAEQADEPHGAAAAQEGGGQGWKKSGQSSPPFMYSHWLGADRKLRTKPKRKTTQMALSI